jgi:hypothetical protein
VPIEQSKLYLDLSGALAALGLIFAVYQLRQPSWDVVLRVRPRWQRLLPLILGGIGFLFALVAVCLDRFGPCWLPAALRDTFPYQILAYVAFAGSPTSLLFFAITKNGLFAEKSAERFYKALAFSVATSDERFAQAVVDVVLHNFRAICKQASSGVSGSGRDYARAILDVILSENAIVKVLTTRQLGGLHFVFATAVEFGLSKSHSSVGIPALMRGLYTDQDSFLYKQYQADGLALAMNIYETIFGSAELLTNFNLFDYRSLDYTMRERIGSTGVHILIESLEKSIKTYLTFPNVPPEHINKGIEYLSEIFGDQCYKIAREPHAGGSHPRARSWEVIDKIADFLGGEVFIDPLQWNQEVRRREGSGDASGFASSVSISAAIAEALCEAFSQLASIDKDSDFTWSYHAVISLLHGVMLTEASFADNYRQQFTDGIWERIKRNVVRRYYPATLLVYLEFIGLLLTSDGANQGHWVGAQTERMRRLLYVDLKPLLDADARMIEKTTMEEALLPKVMRYGDGAFFYTSSFGRGEEAQINPPPPASASALEGVKDDFDRWEERRAAQTQQGDGAIGAEGA